MKNKIFIDAFRAAEEKNIIDFLGILAEYYAQIPDYLKGSFNNLKGQFTNKPNNFQLENWKAQMSVLIMDFPFEIKMPTKNHHTIIETNISNTNLISQMAQIPNIQSKQAESVYILAVDIVSFSKGTDNNQQFIQFERLIELFNKNEHFKNIPQEDTIILLTGDGLALIVKNKTNAIPLFKMISQR